MTPERQNLKIAEACEVQVIYWKAKYDNHGRPDFSVFDTREEAENWPFKELGVESFINFAKIPNYTGDLNAMHEAEKVLRTPSGDVSDAIALDRMHKYAELLGYAIDATASQRAEAFLRVLNLWEDEEDHDI